MERVTILDVAEKAEVSLATVDRVLNRRGGVAAKSVEKVERAVAELGYVRDEAAARMGRKRHMRLAFVVPGAETGFARALYAALNTERAHWIGERVVIETVPVRAFDVAGQVAALRSVEADAVAVMVAEAPEIQAEIARLTEAGVPVVTLVADLPRAARAAYVGPDNERLGRVAGEFMGRFVASGGRVLPIVGSQVARDHTERLMGFRRVLRERFSSVEVLPEAEGHDDAEEVAALLRQALDAGGLAGCYAIGAGTRGVISALAGRDPRPVVICHELTDVSRAGLAEGQLDLVLDQDPYAEIEHAILILRDLVERRPLRRGAGEIEPRLYVRETVL